MGTHGRALAALLPLFLLGTGCETLDRFDTPDDEAYCGSIVSAQFVRTTEPEGGFRRDLRLRLRLHTGALTSRPGTLSSDDTEDGPCRPRATFDEAPLQVTPELFHDTLSTLRFDSAQDHNLLAWVESTCRGPMLAVVSLLRDDGVEVRLLKPGSGATESGGRPAFGLFKLRRRPDGCAF